MQAFEDNYFSKMGPAHHPPLVKHANPVKSKKA